MTTTFNYRNASIAIVCCILLTGLFALVSCEKRVTPRKLERIVVKDTWRVSIFVFEGQNIEDLYTGKTFDFTDEGSIAVVPFNGVKGNYNIGLNKKPSLMYISGFYDSLYFNFNDDWTVTRCSSSKMQFESQNGSNLNRITFIKVED